MKTIRFFGMLLLVLSAFVSFAFAEGTEPNLKEAIASKLKTQETVTLDLFVMSHCPYGVMAEQNIIPLVKEYGGKVTLKLHYIADAVDGAFSSMHGEAEVQEDLRQMAIAKFYPEKLNDYLLERANNFESDNWQEAAQKVDLDAEKISAILTASISNVDFRNDIAISSDLGIESSPTVYLDNEMFKGRILTKTGTSGLLCCQCEGGAWATETSSGPSYRGNCKALCKSESRTYSGGATYRRYAFTACGSSCSNVYCDHCTISSPVCVGNVKTGCKNHGDFCCEDVGKTCIKKCNKNGTDCDP